MNKKVITIALASCFITHFAMADVTLYGFLSASVETVKASGAAGAYTLKPTTRVEDDSSRIGFKGTEDLGNGNQSIWQVENSLKNFAQGGTSDNGQAATFATRNTFVGLNNASYGTLLIGYYDSAYKRLTDLDVGTNVMANYSGADTDGTGSTSPVHRGDARLKNSVHYLTPTWNGLQGAASWGADEANDANTTGRAQRYSLAGHYINSGLIIAAGYDRQDNTTDTLSSTTGTSVGKASAGDNTVFEKLAAAYKFGSGTWLGAAAERASYGANAHNGNMTQNDFILAITQDVGKASFKLSWNKLGNLNNAYVGKASDWDATQWVLGSTYNLSKTTQVVAYYTTINNSQYQNTNFGIAPLYATGMGSGSNTGTANTPTAGDATNLSPGNKLSALGIGMKVSF